MWIVLQILCSPEDFFISLKSHTLWMQLSLSFWCLFLLRDTLAMGSQPAPLMHFKFTSRSWSGSLSTFILRLAVPQQDPWENPIISCLWSTLIASPPHALQGTRDTCCRSWPPEALSYVMQRIRKVGHAWWLLLAPWFNWTLYAGAHIWAKMNPIKPNSLILAKLDLLIFPAWLHNLRWKKLVITLAFPYSTLQCRLVTHLFILTSHLFKYFPFLQKNLVSDEFSLVCIFPGWI